MKRAKAKVLVGFALLCAATAAAFDQGDILFFHSFDHGFDADLGGGARAAAPHGEPELQPGRAGKALLFQNQASGLTFEVKGNFEPARGTIAFWISPDNWVGDNGDVFQYYFSTDGGSDNLVIEHVWYRKGVNLLLFQGGRPIGGFPGALCEALVHTYERESIQTVGPARPGVWRHIAFTWRPGRIVGYLDGKQYGVFKEPKLKLTRSGGRFCIGFPPWHAPIFYDIYCDEQALPQLKKPWRTRIDDFVILRQPLFPSQVSKLYELGPIEYAKLGEADPSELTIEQYPYRQVVQVAVVPGADPERSARCEALLAKAGDDAVLQRAALAPDQAGLWRGELETGTLPDAAYRVWAEIRNGKGDVISRSSEQEFAKAHEPWQGNTIGLEDVVPAPWTPLQLEHDVVACWGREYRFKGAPFPSEIVSRGRQLLAAPMRMTAVAAGRTQAFKWRAPRIAERKATRIRRVQDGVAGDLEAAVEAAVEFDGFVLVTVRVTPRRPVAVDALRVDIPIKREHALLMHWPGRYEGLAPVDEVAFDSYNNYMMWVGDDDRGLYWMTDTFRGWPVSDPNRAPAFLPGEVASVMRVNIIDKPVELTQPLSLQFMIEATPVKPMPKGWRRHRLLHESAHRMTENANRATICFHGSDTWPVFSFSPRPWANSRFATWKAWREHLQSQTERRRMFLPDVLKRFGVAYMPYSALFVRGGRFQKAPYASLPEYQRNYCEWRTIPERVTEGPRSGGLRLHYATVCAGSESYRDYWTWQVVKVVMGQDGLDYDGFYFDIFNPRTCKNTEHGCGWIDAQGEVQGSNGSILGTRELLKRIYIGLKARKPEALLMGHCSGLTNMAYSAFADLLLDGEQFRGSRLLARSGHYSDTFRLGYARAKFSPHAFGFIPVHCSEVGHQVEKKGEIYKNRGEEFESDIFRRHAKTDVKVRLSGVKDATGPFAYNYYRGSRELLAILLLHDVLMYGQQQDTVALAEVWAAHDRFGLAAHDVAFTGYWALDDAVRCSDDRINISSYRRPGARVMLVVSNLTGELREFEVAIVPEKLGLPDHGLIAIDGEAEGPVTPLPRFDGRRLTLAVRDYDVRHVILGPRSSLQAIMGPLAEVRKALDAELAPQTAK